MKHNNLGKSCTTRLMDTDKGHGSGKALVTILLQVLYHKPLVYFNLF